MNYVSFPKYLFEQDLMIVGFTIIYFVALAVSVGRYKTVRSVASTYSGRQGSIGDVHIDYSVLGRFHGFKILYGIFARWMIIKFNTYTFHLLMHEQ